MMKAPSSHACPLLRQCSFQGIAIWTMNLLEKAHDRLRWSFIHETLYLAGLPGSLVGVIMKHNKIFHDAFVEWGYYREFCSLERNSSWGLSLTLYFCSSHWKVSPSYLKSRWKELTGNLFWWLEMVSKSKSVPRRTGLELSRCMGFQWTHNLGKIPWSSFNPREGSLKVLVEISWIEWTED